MAGEDCVVRAWAGLHFAYREMSRLLDERLRAESECSLSDVDVLNELYCTPEQRLQMLVLAERLGVTRGGLTRIVDRLVEHGWVSRERPAHNRREVYAAVTEDGARVLRHARTVYIRRSPRRSAPTSTTPPSTTSQRAWPSCGRAWPKRRSVARPAGRAGRGRSTAARRGGTPGWGASATRNV